MLVSLSWWHWVPDPFGIEWSERASYYCIGDIDASFNNIASNGYSNYSHVCMIEEDYVKSLEMAAEGLKIAKLHEPASPILDSLGKKQN